MVETILTALKESEGGLLAFLPGEGEIRRTANGLEGRLPEGCVVRPLYGALAFKDQQEAIRPERAGRKVVLATAIAETSLTIEDVRIVVDGGLARRARFDPGTGMSRLVTEPASRAETEQRRGRAGRVAPGRCYRIWTRAEEGALPAYPPPEITTSDLTGLALDLASWGARDPSDLSFLTPPGEGPFASARRLLADLGVLDEQGGLTDHGQVVARLPLHPRLAHMLALAGPDAAPLAALLADRDPMRGAGVGLSLRLKALDVPDPRADRAAVERIRGEAKRLRRLAPEGTAHTAAEAAALAYPDRIGLRRPGEEPRWVLTGGTGARMDPEDVLAGQRLLVVTETDGDRREARIRQAIPMSDAELRAVHGRRITWCDHCTWSRREGRVIARRQE
ncbi:MAG: helicase-related protein, partial [Pseudomonadota bacterium]